MAALRRWRRSRHRGASGRDVPGREDRIPLLLHFFRREWLELRRKQSVIAPGRQHEVEDVRHLLVFQIAKRRHHAVVTTTAYFNGSGHAVQNDLNHVSAAASVQQTHGVARERRCDGRERPAVGRMTARAKPDVDLLAALRLKFGRRRRRAGRGEEKQTSDQSPHGASLRGEGDRCGMRRASKQYRGRWLSCPEFTRSYRTNRGRRVLHCGLDHERSDSRARL